MEVFNLALLSRQAWRCLTEPLSLSARILKAAYYPNSSIFEAEVGSHPSQIWRAIYEGKEVLKKGLIRRIGDGKSTSIWNQNWIPRNFMMRALHPNSLNPPKNVVELIDTVERRWNRDRVEQHMQSIDASEIINIPLSSIPMEDSWACQYEHNGLFL